MDFYVMAKSYDSFGAHASVRRIGDFLLQGAPQFGDAIREVIVVLHFKNSGPARQTLESSFERHNHYRSTLPKIVYRRAKGGVKIDVASEVIDGNEWGNTRTISLPHFRRGVEEVIGALGLLRSRLKKGDAFDLTAFLTHCEAAKQRIPEDDATLQILSAELDAAANARFDAKSPWEKLDVDWAEYHPDAKAILDDPFFWDSADDFSPHGNDTGADLLADYRRWLKRRDGAPPTGFLEALAKQWGYADLNSVDDGMLHEAVIALAFADIKLRAQCDPDVRERAIRSVEWQRKEAQSLADWPHRGERLKAIEKIEGKLQQISGRR